MAHPPSGESERESDMNRKVGSEPKQVTDSLLDDYAAHLASKLTAMLKRNHLFPLGAEGTNLPTPTRCRCCGQPVKRTR